MYVAGCHVLALASYIVLGDHCDVGRDKLFAILRSNHLLVKPKRNYHITTYSKHMFYKHKNLIIDLPIVCPEQVWFSDIIYQPSWKSSLFGIGDRCLFEEDRGV